MPVFKPMPMVMFMPMPTPSPDSKSMGKFKCLVCGNSLKILAGGDRARDQTFIKLGPNLNVGQEASIKRDLVWPPPRGLDKKPAIIICSDATLYYRSSQETDGGWVVVVRVALCFTIVHILRSCATTGYIEV